MSPVEQPIPEVVEFFLSVYMRLECHPLGLDVGLGPGAIQDNDLVSGQDERTQHHAAFSVRNGLGGFCAEGLAIEVSGFFGAAGQDEASRQPGHGNPMSQ